MVHYSLVASQHHKIFAAFFKKNVRSKVPFAETLYKSTLRTRQSEKNCERGLRCAGEGCYGGLHTAFVVPEACIVMVVDRKHEACVTRLSRRSMFPKKFGLSFGAFFFAGTKRLEEKY